MEIIPEYLYEFDNFKDADFDYLSEAEYQKFISVIPQNDVALNAIMLSIYDVTMEYAYTGIPQFAPNTFQYIEAAEKAMKDNNLSLPDISLVEKYKFSDFHDWGDLFDGRYLSIILNQTPFDK